MFQVECVKIREDVDGVKTFTFAAPEGFSFNAGQFMTFTFHINGKDVQRSYTISSSPATMPLFTITVRAVPQGLGSNWLHDYLTVGSKLAVSGPYGTFTPSSYETDKLVFLAAGSGITPFLSTLQDWQDRALAVDAQLIFSVRNPQQIIAAQALQGLATHIEGLAVTVLPEEDQHGLWQGPTGRLNGKWLDAMLGDLEWSRVFTCGPAPYMDMIETYLASHHFDLSRFHKEAFGAVSNKPVAQSSTSETVEVAFTESQITVQATAQSTLLEIAEQAGINIKNACRTGICGACQTHKISGEVEMNHLGGILPKDIEKGMILPCCSHPKTNVKLAI